MSAKPEALIASGTNATVALDVVEKWVAKRSDRILRALEGQIAEAGELNNQAAMSACFDMLANRKLLADLDRAVDKGKRTASKLHTVESDK